MIGDNFDPLMSVDEARDVVRSYNHKKSDLHKAEMVLALSNWFGDQMVAHEMRKARFLEVVK